MTARMMRPMVAAIVIVNYLLDGACGAQYFGKFLGKLSELQHGVSGEVYAVDGRTLYIKDFTYDGQGPAAYFYASTSRSASSAGFRLRDENGSPQVIRHYRKEGITLTLPEGKTLTSIKIFYVWCEEFEVNFGDVKIPRNLDYPRPQKIDPLKGVHAISSDNIVIVDAQTLLIPNLSYDGEAPDAKFWVGSGPKPSPQGIRVPDENGKAVPLRKYDRKTVVLTLPGDLTVFDIGHFGIWCEAFTVDFGHVRIPQDLNVPPSLKMLGVSPQSKLNCEVLHDDLAFEVRWAIAGDSIVLQLVAKLENGEYMSFGVSGDDSKSTMIGGDVAVAWVDKDTLKGFAQDYYLGEKSQCSGPTGSCPDNRLSDNTNNIRLLNAAMVNGYSIVTYQRPLRSSDEYDRPIYTNRSQAIIWGIGPLNQREEVSFHSHYLKKNKLLNFGRTPKWNCPMPESEPLPMKSLPSRIKEEVAVTTTAIPSRSRNNSDRRRGGNRSRNQQQVTPSQEDTQRNPSSRNRQSEIKPRGSRSRNSTAQSPNRVPTPAPVSKSVDPWYIPPIQCNEPDDHVFYAQMGPTGGKRGYASITGHVGWGISWYINGLLIPEINVVRGTTYSFVVEGGDDPDIPAKYHPFYITDDSVGGYEHKTPEERKNVRIFAGAETDKDGTVIPNGIGRLCNWVGDQDDPNDFDSFGAYQRVLQLKCDDGEPGFIQWTPDRNTPDTVYYQCFTHRYLGWKINVLDSCDADSAGSEVSEVIVPAPEDLDGSPSVRVESRVKLNALDYNGRNEDKDNESTVSEKSLTSINPKPSGIASQRQLQNRPILIHQPSQIFMSHQAPFLAHPSTSFTNHPSLVQMIGHEIMTIMKSTSTPKPAIVVTPQFSGRFLEKLPDFNQYTMKPSYRIKPEHRYITQKKQLQSVRQFSSIIPIPNPTHVEVSPMQVPTDKPEIARVYPESLASKPRVMEDYLPAKKLELEYESELGLLPHHLAREESAIFVRTSSTHGIGDNKKMTRSSMVDDAAEEPETAAAERVESYYLPPLGAPVKQSLPPRQRSNIDIDDERFNFEHLASPPDIVVTYDGRKVSGASLTAARISDRTSVFDMRTSKAAELIKARPQFAPFKGELPPLNPEIINRNVPQLQARGVLSRDLDTPPIGGTTKLRPIIKRTKREAHHTPEHSAQQQKARNGTDGRDETAVSAQGCTQLSFIVIVAAPLLHKYI